jgi:hypothetical protein
LGVCTRTIASNILVDYLSRRTRVYTQTIPSSTRVDYNRHDEYIPRYLGILTDKSWVYKQTRGILVRFMVRFV